METTLDSIEQAAGHARRIRQLQALIDDDSVIEETALQAGTTFVTATKAVILTAVQAELAAATQQLSVLGLTLAEPEVVPET